MLHVIHQLEKTKSMDVHNRNIMQYLNTQERFLLCKGNIHLETVLSDCM